MGVLLPVAVGAVLTFVLLTRAVDWMMNNRYNVMFHGIIGLVIAATIFTIPFAAFTASVSSCLIHIVFVVLGCVATLLLDKFNSKVEKPDVEKNLKSGAGLIRLAPLFVCAYSARMARMAAFSSSERGAWFSMVLTF